MVRLGLERGHNGADVVEIMCSLVEKYGSDNIEFKDSTKFCFVICDPNEVWILNFVGKLWCAERLTEGFRRIVSFGLSVKTKIDKSSDGLKAKALGMGAWNGCVRTVDTFIYFLIIIFIYFRTNLILVNYFHPKIQHQIHLGHVMNLVQISMLAVCLRF